MSEIGILQNATGLGEFVIGDQHAARQDAERTFQDAHVAVGNLVRDAGVGQDCPDKGKQDGIVTAKQFFQEQPLP